MPERSQETHINCNNYSGKKKGTCTYPLEFVKFDFYKKSTELLIVQVYIEEIQEDSLNIEFKENAFLVQFKTKSAGFLKLYEGTSEETIFEWPVNLRHTIIYTQSEHTLSKKKLTLTLKKGNLTDQWQSLEALNYDCSAKRSRTKELNNSMAAGNGDKIEHSNHVNNETNREQLYRENNSNGRTEHDINGCSNTTACNPSTNETNDVTHVSKSAHNNTKRSCKNDISEEQKTQRDLQHSNNVHSSKRVCGRRNENDIAHDDNKTIKNGCDPSKASLQRKTEISASENYKFSYDAAAYESRPGAVGLVNKSSLCYINSIVQCLSAVKQLRTYMLGKKHCADINSQNKHGFGGQLACCFGTLVEDLWSGSKRCCSAMKLKNVLGRKYKQFTHLGQGDAQEFLTFLLDGLHEDLKIEKKVKVIGEQESGYQKDIMGKGQQYWTKFINGNQSIMIDLFHGLTVSEIRCKHCNQPSIKYDPWMQLNLPIPNDPKYLPIYVFFQDPAKKPLKVKLKVCQGMICRNLLIQIGKLVNIPANHLVLFRSQYGKIVHIYEPMDDLAYSCMKEYFVACQLVVHNETDHFDDKETENDFADINSIPQIQARCGLHESNVPLENDKEDNSSRVLHISVIQRSIYQTVMKCNFCLHEKSDVKYCTTCFGVAYCNRECQAKHWKCHRPNCKFQPKIIGCPFILSIVSSQATLEELKKKALHYASFSVTVKNAELENAKFQLTLLEQLTDHSSKGKTLTTNGDSPVVNDNVCLALDWLGRTRDNSVLSMDMVCENHESIKNELSPEDKLCYLNDCLKLYWNPETINRECGWRCDHCKDVRPASRKTTIVRHPKNMIIHIKRFSYVNNGKKIEKDVHFPLRGLDMSAFSYRQFPDEAIYDLRAVCCHYGIMNFGHYVTYSMPYSPHELKTLGWAETDGWLKYDDSKVSSVAESDVTKAQAYMLFYQRRDKNTISSSAPSLCPSSISTSISKARENKSSEQGAQKNKIEPSLEFQNKIQAQQNNTHDACSKVEIPQEDELD